MLRLKAPTVAYIQVTDTCNYLCHGCAIHSAPLPNKILSFDGWRIVLERVLPYVQEIRILGGEPALNDDLFSLLDVIQEKRVMFSIFSNGFWPSPDAMIRRLACYSCLDRLVVNLPGHDKLSHDEYTKVPGSFVQIKKNIMHAVMSGLRVHLHALVNSQTPEKLDCLHSLARSLGVESLVLTRHNCIAPGEATDPGRETWSALIRETATRSYENPSLAFDDCLPHCLLQGAIEGCYGGICIAAIDPCGNLHPCPRDPSIWGNLLRTPLEKIWKSGNASSWRKRPLPSTCDSCGKVDRCFGGCKCRGTNDPLIQVPRESPQAVSGEETQIKKIDGTLCPVGDFSIRKESFGFALIRGQLVIPTSHKFAAVMNLLDGKHSLLEINSQAGEEMLSFLYSLYERDFIFFAQVV